MTHAEDLARAQRTLSRRSPQLRKIIKFAGPCDLKKGRPANDFSDLVRTVVYQQLAGRAAATILGRVIDALGDEVTPERIGRTKDAKLREAGLSLSKLTTIKGLAKATLDGDIDFKKIRKLDDDEIVEQLTQVKGIGPWTSHMFLMFQLGRLDVWPTGDYGVRVGYTKLFNLGETVEPKKLEEYGDAYRPYRSVVAWYCWRAVDMPEPVGGW